MLCLSTPVIFLFFLMIFYRDDYEKKKHSSVLYSGICGDGGLVLADR